MMVEKQYLHGKNGSPDKVGHAYNQHRTFDTVHSHDSSQEDRPVNSKRTKSDRSEDHQSREDKKQCTAEVKDLEEAFLLFEGRAEVGTGQGDNKECDNG